MVHIDCYSATQRKAEQIHCLKENQKEQYLFYRRLTRWDRHKNQNSMPGKKPGTGWNEAESIAATAKKSIWTT